MQPERLAAEQPPLILKPRPQAQLEQAPHNKQSSVVRLLKLHSAKVEQLRKLVSTHPHFKPERHDGLWLLRYLLSHRLRVPTAAKAARTALQIRHDLQLDEIAQIVRTRPPNEWPHFDKVRRLAVLEELAPRPFDENPAERAAWDVLERRLYEERAPPAEALADAQAAHRACGGVGKWQWYHRGLIEVGMLSEMRMHDLWPLRSCLEELNVYCDEWVFQVLDEATRQTGDIVKVVRTLSLKGFKVKQLNLKMVRWDAGCKARTQDLYPQQLGQMLFIDPPKSLLWAWDHLVKPLLPRRVAEKTLLVNSASAVGRATIEQHSRLDSLPAFLGGSSRVPWPPPEDTWMPPIGPLVFGAGSTFRRCD